jgi:hypothetical protein
MKAKRHRRDGRSSSASSANCNQVGDPPLAASKTRLRREESARLKFCSTALAGGRSRVRDIIHVMTRLMEKAVEALRSLPEEQQDAVAGFVLSEVESDRRWAATSLQHADKLRKLADEAREDFQAGRTSELDPETL